MEETDIYYYIVLEDSVFIKMRLLYEIVLIIDELYPLTTSYISPLYERIFNLLKTQTAVTVIVSLIGNAAEFRQTCVKFDAPIIDDDRFIGCASNFYTKYKNYCGNDVKRYGFFLIALKDETFTVIENKSNNSVIIEDNHPTDIENESGIVSNKLYRSEELVTTTETTAVQINIHPIIKDLLKNIKTTKFGTMDVSFNDGVYALKSQNKDISLELVIFDYTIQVNPIISNSVGDIMDIIRIIRDVSITCRTKLYFVNVSESNISYPVLSMEYQEVKYFPPELKNTFVNPRLQVYFVG